MQTFLPYPDFAQSAKCLDSRRLGKQRVEARQLLAAITGQSSRWSRHPAARMWKFHPEALTLYGNVVIQEWISRSYRNTMEILPILDPAPLPPWLGDPAFHASHRSNLLRKDPAYYGQLGWTEPHDLPYLWPIDER